MDGKRGKTKLLTSAGKHETRHKRGWWQARENVKLLKSAGNIKLAIGAGKLENAY